jgi:hypothetical protein
LRGQPYRYSAAVIASGLLCALPLICFASIGLMFLFAYTGFPQIGRLCWMLFFWTGIFGFPAVVASLLLLGWLALLRKLRDRRRTLLIINGLGIAAEAAAIIATQLWHLLSVNG